MFTFSNKAHTLRNLSQLVTRSKIPSLLVFTKSEYCADRSDVLTKITSSFNNNIIVRSSCANEDQGDVSNAGKYLSIADICSSDVEIIDKAIFQVIASYDAANNFDEVDDYEVFFIQEMVQNVAVSGVLFTKDLSTGAPYYCINYDDTTGSTDTITSGASGDSKTLYVLRDRWQTLSSERFIKLLSAVQEIETYTKNSSLDIEFAIDANDRIFLLQARPLALSKRWSMRLESNIISALADTSAFLRDELSEDEKAELVLGRMPDWNPAEIIGTTPTRLSYTMYKYLITDQTWARARTNMGYTNLVGEPLLRNVAGHPFVDVTRSFRSFIPSTLDNELKDKLVGHWIDRLNTNPKLHDKVEFEIALTSWSFDFEARMDRLLPTNLDDKQRTSVDLAYYLMTKKLIEGHVESIEQNLHKIDQLNIEITPNFGLSIKQKIDKLHRLLINTIEYGTLPFSTLARHGFIAVQIIQSLVKENLISVEEADTFLLSINTVASEFNNACVQLSKNEISDKEFFKMYGHLRPGTYDITSDRYDTRDISAFLTNITNEEQQKDFRLSANVINRVSQVLRKHQFNMSAEELFSYCKSAIEAREFSKFQFTKQLSAALQLITDIGDEIGLSNSQLAHLSVSDILFVQTEIPEGGLFNYWSEKIRVAQDKFETSIAIKLPYLITRESDLYIIPLSADTPNYITQRTVTGKKVLLEKSSDFSLNIDGKIIVIESADPGFDWIFGRKILGLVTKFGGANSHMAIRCAEFDIGAAIGVGEYLFEKIISSSVITLNCAEKKIEMV